MPPYNPFARPISSLTAANMTPTPFTSTPEPTDRQLIVKQFLKNPQNKIWLLQHTQDNPKLLRQVKRLFTIRELINIQKNLFKDCIDDRLDEGLFEAVHDIRSKWLAMNPLDRPFRPNPPQGSCPQPSPSGGRRGKDRLVQIAVVPLSHWNNSAPSSSWMIQTPTLQTIINLTSPSPEPTLQPLNSYPEYMHDSTCFHCRKKGHFTNYCPNFVWTICGENAPQHYPSTCPLRASATLPPRYQNVDDSADPNDFYFNFDDEAIANITGEPINY